jgi:hypothetical protein
MTRHRILIVTVALAACGKSASNGEGKGGVKEEHSGNAASDETSEGKRQLRAIESGAKVYLVENLAFPTGQTGLTPATACCDGPDKQCAPDATLWQGEPWASLDVAVDEPSDFQYSYASADGKTFLATAVGDPGCKGTPVTYTLSGMVDSGGNPTFELSK